MTTPVKPATLGDLLKTAGVEVAPAPKTAAAAAPAAAAPAKVAAAPAAAAPAKTAAGKGTIPPSQPAHEPARTPRSDHTQPEKQDTGAAGSNSAASASPAKKASFNEMGVMIEDGKVIGVDARIYKTAAQQKLASIGTFCLDPVEAESLLAAKVAAAQQAKQAQLEKLAEEERFKGALQYHGMVAESTAMRLANGQATLEDVAKVASMIRVPAEQIIKRAEALKADGERAAAPGPALVGGNLGSAARTSSSRTQEAAQESRETVGYEPEAVAGTRQPTTGMDEKLIRFTDTYTLPGNPGLDKGMKVDQGKGLGQ